MVPELPVLERSFLRDVSDALEPVRRKQRDLHTFLASQLERLELQAAEVEERERQAADERDALTKERASLDEEWSHFDELVETARAHAVEVHQEKQRLEALLRQQDPGEHQAELKRLNELLEHAVGERTALEAELAASRRKLGELADTAVELNEVRAELERLRAAPGGIDPAVLAQCQADLAECRQQCERLAGELKQARQQAADYLRDRDEDRRRYSEERSEWLGELRSLRQMLHAHPAEHEREVAPIAAAPTPPLGESGLDAMLNRFDAVKRDAVRHRPNRS